MTTSEFKEYCLKQLIGVFTQAKRGTKDVILKARVEGILHAGEVLGLFSRLESQEIVEQAHIAVWGESVAFRQQRSKQLKIAIETGDFAVFESPAVLRKP